MEIAKDFEAGICKLVGVKLNQTIIDDERTDTTKYEISFKGDIDSASYSDSDFNSDLDAINIYERMQSDKIKTADIFKIQAVYHEGIRNNTFNRVKEFYRNLGNGDESKGKEQLKKIVNSHSAAGHSFKLIKVYKKSVIPQIVKDAETDLGGAFSKHVAESIKKDPIAFIAKNPAKAYEDLQDEIDTVEQAKSDFEDYLGRGENSNVTH